MEEHGLQCGFCTPGMMLTARRCSTATPTRPTDEIREAISGQICRCTGYATIVALGAAGRPSTTRSQEVTHDRRWPTDPRTSANPIGFGRMQRKEDARFVRGQGQLRRRRPAAGDAARRDPAQPVRARPDRLDRHVGGAASTRRCTPSSPGKDLEALGLAWMPTLSYDVAGRARHRQGALPGPGGRVRRRRGPLRRPRRARADRRRVRAAARRSSTRARRSTPDAPVIRDDIEGKTDNHIFDWEAGDAAATDAVFAARRGRRRAGHALPARAPGADGDLRRRRRLSTRSPASSRSGARPRRRTRTARSTRSSPGSPSTRSGSISPDIGGGFGNKVGDLPRLRAAPSSARSSPASR